MSEKPGENCDYKKWGDWCKEDMEIPELPKTFSENSQQAKTLSEKELDSSTAKAIVNNMNEWTLLQIDYNFDTLSPQTARIILNRIGLISLSFEKDIFEIFTYNGLKNRANN